MKRLISLVLTLSLTLSLLPAAFAASDEAIQAAESLNALGLFGGVGNNADGTPNFDLDRAPTRQEAITMLVRLLGKEEDAKAGTWETPFTDVDDWAKPYVGYAYANKLGGGTSPTTFSGNDPVTAAQYLTFILRALGYKDGDDFQWDKAWELSDKIGLTDGRYNAETTSFTRGDVAIISYSALAATEKGSEKQLSETLGIVISTPKEYTIEDMQGIWRQTKWPNVEVIIEGNKATYMMYNGLETVYTTGTFALAEDGTLKWVTSDYYLAYGNTLVHNSEPQYPFPGTYSTLHTPAELYAEYEKIQQADLYERCYGIVTAYTERYPAKEESSSNGSNPDLDKDYSYLAAADFRNVRRDYSQAVAQCGYAQAFIDLNGDLCILTHVRYKIISNYSVTTLHNLTKGTTITEPADYYASTARRLYGSDQIKYYDLQKEVLTVTAEMLEAMLASLTTGKNPGKGNYVNAETLNQ